MYQLQLARKKSYPGRYTIKPIVSIFTIMHSKGTDCKCFGVLIFCYTDLYFVFRIIVARDLKCMELSLLQCNIYLLDLIPAEKLGMSLLSSLPHPIIQFCTLFQLSFTGSIVFVLKSMTSLWCVKGGGISIY